MNYRPLIGIITLLMLLNTGLIANSVFSFDGFPKEDYNNDVFGMGTGEAGIADTFRRNTSFFNPSLSTTLNQVYFSTGISTGYYFLSDENQQSRTDGVSFPYFNMTIPLANHRLGFSYAAYLSANADVYGSNREWEGLTYREVNKIRSYIYKGSFFYAFKNDIVNAGVSFNYLLGHRFQSWEQQFKNAGVFENPRYELNRTFRNYGFSAGLNKSFGNLSLGLAYNSPVEMTGKTELLTVIDSVFVMEESKFETPHHIGGGFVWRFQQNFRLLSDVHYELWSQTGSFLESSADTRDTYKIAFGIAYEPFWGNEQWYRKIPLRLGGYIRTLPFKAEGNFIDEKAATFGFTIPLQTPNSQLDFAVKYLMRGNTADHKFADESLVFSVGLSGFDFFRSRQKKTEAREIPNAEFDTFRY